MPAQITFTCSYCSNPIGPAITHDTATADETTWRAYWKSKVDAHSAMRCVACDSVFDVIDDGVAASAGGGLITTNVTQPKVTSISPVTGTDAGGTTVTVTGDFLEVGALVIKFGGVAGTNLQNRTQTSVDVDTPAVAAGAVDMTVENEFGQRSDGSSTLVGGYTYT